MRRFLLFCFSILFSVCLINAQQRSYYSTADLNAPQVNVVKSNGVQSATGSTPNDTLNYLDAGAIYGVTGDGYVAGTNKYGDLGKYQRFDLSQAYLLKGFEFYTMVRVVTAPADTLSFVVKTVNGDGTPGTTIATIRAATSSLNANGWNTFTLSNPLPVANKIFIGYEWTAAVKDTFGLASDQAGHAYGNGALRAWEKGSDGVYLSMNSSWGASFDVDLWITAIAEKVIPISQARADVNADFIPDRLNDTVTVKGVVFTPNYQTSNRSYYIWDGTGGLCTFRAGLLSPALNLGDSVVVRGQIQQFNGLDEIAPITDTQVWVVGTGATLPTPLMLTAHQYNTNIEQYEGTLVRVQNLAKLSGAWPGTGSSANIILANGSDSVTVRVDSDTDIDGNPEPAWPKDVIGVLTQFSSGGSFSNGYQLQPRYYATDFPNATAVPVELTSFTANVSNGKVNLTWNTATELNNKGFDVERRSAIDNSWTTISFVKGNGSTLSAKQYSYTDNSVNSGKFIYRLKQIDDNGTFKYSNEVNADVNVPGKFSLGQNYPNPFNPSTKINYTLPVDSRVKIELFNITGQKVAELVNNEQAAGFYSLNVGANTFRSLSSGVYIYKMTAIEKITGKNFMSSMKLMLMK